ncbi:MAG: hypothetical protein D6738_02555 [Acidobacteria bacterium]|nr:MAG: hypothetical protein D6738_02555 [Acidobacteriota bacterium]
MSWTTATPVLLLFGRSWMSDLLIMALVGVPIALVLYVLVTIFGRRSEADRLRDLYGPSDKGSGYRDKTRTETRPHIRKDDVL